LIMFIAAKAVDERLVLALDEFPYLAESDRNIPSLLQRLIDTTLVQGKLFLILCGSSVSFMEREVLGYDSPLFGRRTAQFKLAPFSFFDSRKFLPGFSNEDQLQVYGTVGGIPQYLNFFSSYSNYATAIEDLFLDSGAYFYEEPLLLLRQELREPTTYNSIIAAVADGASKLNEIATRCGESNEKCNKYLNVLIDLHIIERETSILQKANSRKSIFKINDNLFRFWFKYIFRNKNLIEGGDPAVVLQKKIIPDIETFCGPVFEQVCTQWLMQKNANFELPFAFEQCGRWWGNNPATRQEEEIDICAVDGRNALFVECKWRNSVSARQVVTELERKASLVSRDHKYFYLFTKKQLQPSVLTATQLCFAELLNG